MKHVAVLALSLVAVTACRGVPEREVSVGAVGGRVEGATSYPDGAHVEVYRDGPGRSVAPLPGESADLDRLGRFRIRVLSPGRYLIVYRPGDAPPSIAQVRVPEDRSVTLRPVVEARLTQLRIHPVGDGRGPQDIQLTEATPSDRVADRRDVVVGADAAPLVRGMRPGKWRIDVPDLGASTEINVVVGIPQCEMLLDAPPIGPGAELEGRVTLLDGSPAEHVVVTVRRLTESEEAGQPWARYAPTDAAGRYRVVGIPPGKSLVRVECRESIYNILPSAHVVQIPPSGRLTLGFVVEP